MKRIILICVFSLMASVCNAQEWFTSFDVAKRLALVQNKMLFVVWEDSFNYSIPVSIKVDSRPTVIIDLAKDTSLDPVIWKYFIPVRLSEAKYSDFIQDAKGRGYKYINKLDDDSIKIMDVNGAILNVNESSGEMVNFYSLINKYSVDTSFLNFELKNYLDEKNFLTSTLLALKYIDYAIFTTEELRPEIIRLADIYLDESEEFLSEMDENKRETFSKKIELIRIKELLILNQHKKAYRLIKRINENELAPTNLPMFEFLNYIIFKSLNDEANADLWKSKISLVDLRKAELILKNNMDGNSN